MGKNKKGADVVRTAERLERWRRRGGTEGDEKALSPHSTIIYTNICLGVSDGVGTLSPQIHLPIRSTFRSGPLGRLRYTAARVGSVNT